MIQKIRKFVQKDMWHLRWQSGKQWACFFVLFNVTVVIYCWETISNSTNYCCCPKRSDDYSTLGEGLNFVLRTLLFPGTCLLSTTKTMSLGRKLVVTLFSFSFSVFVNFICKIVSLAISVDCFICSEICFIYYVSFLQNNLVVKTFPVLKMLAQYFFQKPFLLV